MKNVYGAWVIVVAAVCVASGCLKSVYSSPATNISPSVITSLQNKWQYVSWASCPENPLSAAPCFYYDQANKALYGTGHIMLEFSNSNKLYRYMEGNIAYFPVSYVFNSVSDTLGYQMVSDSSFIIFNTNKQVIDTVKIKALATHLLVLAYRVPQFENIFQTDSLTR